MAHKAVVVNHDHFILLRCECNDGLFINRDQLLHSAGFLLLWCRYFLGNKGHAFMTNANLLYGLPRFNIFAYMLAGFAPMFLHQTAHFSFQNNQISNTEIIDRPLVIYFLCFLFTAFF